MAYIEKRIINGKHYFYLRTSKRIGIKMQKKTIAYLGQNLTVAALREKLADFTGLESEKIIKQFKRALKSVRRKTAKVKI